MNTAGKNDLQAFVARLRDEPDSVMALRDVGCVRDLWRMEELAALAQGHGVTVLAMNSFANELRAAGFRKARAEAIEGVGPMDVNTQQRGKAKLWIIRNADKMAGWKNKQFRDHYLEQLGNTTTKF
jgi:hypothetical protein